MSKQAVQKKFVARPHADEALNASQVFARFTERVKYSRRHAFRSMLRRPRFWN